MPTLTPKSGARAALLLAAVTFVAAFAAAYPYDLSPIATGALAGGCALVPAGMAILLSGDRGVGVMTMVLGVAVSVVVVAPLVPHHSIRPAPVAGNGQGPGISSQPATEESPLPEEVPPSKQASSSGPLRPSRSPHSAGTAETITTAPTGTTHSPPGATTPAVQGPGYTTLSLAGRAVSQETPRISASVTSGYHGSQRVTVTMSGLGRSSIEWDMYTPDGGTFVGSSFGSPQDSVTYVYDVHPPASGTYELTVRNKNTGANSAASVYLEQDLRTPYVLQRAESGDPAVSVSSLDGRLCSRAEIALHLSGVGRAETARVELNDGQYADFGLDPDALGSDYINFSMTSERCTGRDETVGMVTVYDRSERVVTTTDLSVPN